MVPCGVKRKQALHCPLPPILKLCYASLEMCDLSLQVRDLRVLHALLDGYRCLRKLRRCAIKVLDGVCRRKVHLPSSACWRDSLPPEQNAVQTTMYPKNACS